jgi:hypothetical protein
MLYRRKLDFSWGVLLARGSHQLQTHCSCTWYARGESVDAIDSLAYEYDEISADCVGAFILGNMKIHHGGWYANLAASLTGFMLHDVCDRGAKSNLSRSPRARMTCKI